MSSALCQARMELRISESMKELLFKTAALDGIDLTAFALASVIEKARQVVKDHAKINLLNQGQFNLVQALSNHGEPTPAMRELMTLHALENFDA